MSTQTFIQPSEPLLSRRANDFLVDPRRFRPPGMLFDEFWRDGELALLFGPHASGKSVLAVQLGDALARGTGLHGFRTPRGRRRVLYVDLRHTDEQFQMRSADTLVHKWRMPRTRRHRFPRNLFRDRPPAGSDLCNWLRGVVAADKIQVAIIDDLAAVKNTYDGTRETLSMMRRLRAMRDELGISILVIADSREPAHGAPSEADLGRSRVLCTVADSVFAVGRGLKCSEDHYLGQTRVRHARPFWTAKNAPVAHVCRSDSGLLVLDFDERFDAKIDEKTRALLVRLITLRGRGSPFRTIAAELGISKSYAHQLYQKWKPAILRGDLPGFGSPPYAAEHWPSGARPERGADASSDGVVLSWNPDELEDDHTDIESNFIPDADRYGIPIAPSGPGTLDPQAPHKLAVHRIPFLASLRRRSIYDLEIARDPGGNVIYIESRDEHTRQPIVWYTIAPNGHVTRHERKGFGIHVEGLGKTEYV